MRTGLSEADFLRKFDNHDVAIITLGGNVAHNAKMIMKFEKYVDFLERKITSLERRVDRLCLRR